jgi:hypothetical protein
MSGVHTGSARLFLVTSRKQIWRQAPVRLRKKIYHERHEQKKIINRKGEKGE